MLTHCIFKVRRSLPPVPLSGLPPGHRPGPEVSLPQVPGAQTPPEEGTVSQQETFKY